MRAYAALVTFYVTSLALVSQSLARKERTRVQRLLETSSGSETTNSTTGLAEFLTFPVVAFSDAGDTMTALIEAELVEALETDEQVTVVGDVDIGVLSCEYLEGAEDATTLQVAVSPYETILAEKTSYTYLSGDAFADGLARKVWIGEELVDNVMDPRRTVTITWGEVCTVETFLLKVTTSELDDGAFSVVKSVPCIPDETTTNICVVETEVVPEEEDEPEDVLIQTDAPVRGRALGQSTTRHSRATKGFVAKGERKLETATTIDVMYLYTEGSKDILGSITDTQMQTTLATALATANEAMTNSGIDLTLSLVYVGLLPYEETSTSSSTILENLQNDESVADLRDSNDADLVQLAGYLGLSCGRANLFTGNSTDGFSAINPICIDYLSHTHEMGHNLGCYHNRDDSTTQTDYAHGYRYCETTDPYRTIMSYYCSNDVSVPRLNWFSNPDVTVLDKASGTTDNDCARAIEENMATISEFRPVIEEPLEDVNACFDTTDTAEYRCSGKKNGRIVDLNRCELTDTETDLLRECFEVVDVAAITKIKLNVNSFSSLPYDLFDGMDSLATLNLQRNCDLTCIPPVNAGTNVLLSSCSSSIGTCEA